VLAPLQGNPLVLLGLVDMTLWKLAEKLINIGFGTCSVPFLPTRSKQIFPIEDEVSGFSKSDSGYTDDPHTSAFEYFAGYAILIVKRLSLTSEIFCVSYT